MAEKPFVSPRRLKRFFTGLLGEKLNTKEEILANTDEKKFAGAMAVQEMYGELNDSLGGVQFGIDGEGNRCYLGADGSLIPFQKSCLDDINVITLSTPIFSTEIGKKYLVFEDHWTTTNSTGVTTVEGATIIYCSNVASTASDAGSRVYSTVRLIEATSTTVKLQGSVGAWGTAHLIPLD